MDAADLSDRDRPAGEAGTPWTSNELRLSGKQCIITGAITLFFLMSVPAIWRGIEPFEPTGKYRIPYALGNDYWLYRRYCRILAARRRVFVLGDSVVWGEYVTPEHTLSSFLNGPAGEDRFANAGFNGTHPLAIAGLVQYYGRGISGSHVIIHFNPLWISSARRDLQTQEEVRFNHPRLIPQFVPNVPAYEQSFAEKLGVIIERNFDFASWLRHIRTVYFEGEDLRNWTAEHPYGNPFGSVTLELPEPVSRLRHRHVPWTKRRIRRQGMPWVGLATSYQWNVFRRTVEILRRRGNRVFVLIGPFNEHMLTKESLDAYNKIKDEIESWVLKQELPFYMPEALPSEYYADASHPLKEGYAMLAERIYAQESFRKWLRGPE